MSATINLHIHFLLMVGYMGIYFSSPSKGFCGGKIRSGIQGLFNKGTNCLVQQLSTFFFSPSLSQTSTNGIEILFAPLQCTLSLLTWICTSTCTLWIIKPAWHSPTSWLLLWFCCLLELGLDVMTMQLSSGKAMKTNSLSSWFGSGKRDMPNSRKTGFT